MTMHPLHSAFTAPASEPKADGAYSAIRLLRFSALVIPLYAAAQPVMAYVPALLSRHYGIPLATLGLLFLIGQAVNSLLDPLVGSLSDRTQSRFGRRRPWILGGGVLFIAGSAILFFPPTGVSTLWIALGVILYYCGASALSTPLMAWSGEISGDYHERTRIAALFTLLSSCALVLALVLPAIADQLRPGDGQLRLTLFGTLVLATALPGLWLTLTAVPDIAPPALERPLTARAGLKAVLGNPLLLRVLAADAAVTAGQGVRTGLLLFVVTFALGRPEWAAGMFLFQYSFGVLAAPIWSRVGKTLGKAQGAVVAELVQAAINFGLLFISADRFWLMLLLAALQGLSQGSGNLMLRSIVSDIADHHRLATGEDRTGLYFSVFGISIKLGGALAVGIALPLVAWLGFDPKAAANTPEALRWLIVVFALGPALAHSIAAALMLGFPLDARRHSEIRRQLEARDSVVAAALVPAE